MDERRAAVIAVGNLKGGTGKSTIAVNLACALAAAGEPTIVIDADPQLTATRWLRGRKVPASVFEAPLGDFAATPAWIAELQEIRRHNAFVIIDLPAVLGAALASALLLADLMLIPTSPSAIDLSATTRTLQRVARAAAERRMGVLHSLVVPTRIDAGWFDDGGLRRLKIRVPSPLAPPIRRSELFAQAFDAGNWIGGFAPRSPAHRDIRALMAAARKALESPPPLPKPTAIRPAAVMAAGLTA